MGNNPVRDENLKDLYTMGAFLGDRDLQSKEWYRSYYSDCLVGYDRSSEVIHAFMNALDLVRRFSPGKRLLDLGCATGVFLDLAREAGFQGLGVEVSEELAAYARENFHLEVKVGPLEQHGLPTASVDCITMMDSIEHIPSYDTLLPEIHRILAPTGLLVIRTPTQEGSMRRFAHWINAVTLGRWESPLLWFYSFEHVNMFDATTLTGLLGRHRFRQVRVSYESESPARLDVPGPVKGALRIFETMAGLVGKRHKMLLLAAKA